ncbi:hypothetical protein CW748_03670 [Alteromonadales bacterium alter-6D02]|nr:hypothetical protein CW748_03670 [Alteromonadales bacterium alter-6D02]
MLAFALELRNISKSYQHVNVLTNATLTVAPGSIHGLIGENGAGKSTLLQIAYGLIKADEGQVYVDGAKVDIINPQQAITHGVGMLHQHVSWLEDASVLDNIILGDPVTSVFYQNSQQASKQLEQLRREFGFPFSLDTLINELNFSERQLVDVLRSLYRGVRVLVLDEPMALLSQEQESYLANLLTMLKMQGISVLIVSHKLASLHLLCDVISLLKSGQITETIEPKKVSLAHVTKLMVGREVILPHQNLPRHGVNNTTAIEVKKLTVDSVSSGRKARGFPLLDSIDLTFYAGEIVAIAGLNGAGQELLLSVIAGYKAFNQGELVFLGNKNSANSGFNIKRMRKLGGGFIANPGLGLNLVDSMTMVESSFLGYQREYSGWLGLFNKRDLNDDCYKLMQQWQIKPMAPQMQTSLFSAGNKQKMVLAKETSRSPQVLLLDQPTQGVDISGVEMIYKALFKLRDEGCCILVCSNDLDEVISLSDKIVVISQGKVTAQVDTQSINKTSLGLLLANG